MNRWSLTRGQLIGLLIVVAVPLIWLLWYAQNGRTWAAREATAVVTPATLIAAAATELPLTAPPASSPTPAPATVTPAPTVTPLSTATSVPTSTATETVTPSPATITLPADPVDRTCPEPPPLRPEYNRYYLSPRFWPTPDPAAPVSHLWLSHPLPGGDRLLLNQGYPYGSDGSGRYLLHNGIDLAEPIGTPVLAVADGTVVVAQSDQNELYGWRCHWYGQLVVIQMDDTWLSQPVYVLYGHVLNIGVAAGQRVERGDPLAEIGFGGVATAPHLHLEIRVGTNEFGSTRNPALWLSPGTHGIIAGRLIDPEGRPWQGVALTLIGGGNDEEPELTNTWSYLGDPSQLANPDEGQAENFVFADVRPGQYEIYTRLQGVEYRIPVQVAAGEISTVEMVTEAFKTPTPAPEMPAAAPTSLTPALP